MRLKRLVLVWTVCLFIAGEGWLPAQSQEAGSKQPSLGDLARRLNTKRAEAERKPSKVFTNDNLPARPTGRGLTVAAQMAPEARDGQEDETEAVSEESLAETAESTEAEAQAAETTEPAPSGSESGDVHDEEWYRGRAGEIRGRLEVHQRQLSVLEQKLAQNQMQFYGDPNRTLQQEFSRSDVTNLTQDIEKKKQEIADDEQALSDLQDQLRREGAPAGWLR